MRLIRAVSRWLPWPLLLAVTACQERAILGTVPSLQRLVPSTGPVLSVESPVTPGAPPSVPPAEPLRSGLGGLVLGPGGTPLADVLVRADLVSNHVAGLVSNGASSLVSNGAASLIQSMGFGIQRVDPVTRTDGQGRFFISIGALPDATASYNLEAILDDGYKAWLPDRMVSTATVSMQLEHTGRIIGQLRAANTLVTNLEGITVGLPGTSYVGTSDRQGRFVLDHLPRGTFRLLAGKPGVGTISVASISIRPDETTDLGSLDLQFIRPTLMRITPSTVTPGMRVILEGQELGITSGETLTVDFPGARATLVDPIDATRVAVTVPANAGTGEVSATVNGLVSNGLAVRVVEDLAFTAGSVRYLEDRLAIPDATRSVGLTALIDRNRIRPDFPVTWEVNPPVATVSALGDIRATGTGSCVVTARFGPRLQASQTWWALAGAPIVSTVHAFLPPATGSMAHEPIRVMPDPDGSIWVLTTTTERLLKLSAAQSPTVTVVAGSSTSTTANTMLGGPTELLPGTLDRPQGLARLASGDIVIADSFHHAVRVLEQAPAPNGSLRILAAAGGTADFGNNRTETGAFSLAYKGTTTAYLQGPAGCAVTPNGAIVVGTMGSNGIFRFRPGIDPGFMLVAGGVLKGFSSDGTGYNAAFQYPYDVLAVDDRTVLVAERYGPLIRSVDLDTGVTSTLAGSLGGHQDGDARSARFSQPAGIARGPMDWIVVSEVGNNRIRAITPEGEVLTLAGSGLTGKVDGTSLAMSRFSAPHGIAWDASNHRLLVADSENSCIRAILLPGL